MSSIEFLDAAGVLGTADSIVEVYREVFAGPPWSESEREEADFRDQLLPAYVREAGFVCAVARTADRLDGFALGSCAALTDRLRSALIAELGAVDAADWVNDVFKLIELAVRPACRGRGLGAALHDSVMARQTARRALLITHRDAVAAFALYRSRDWQTLIDGYLSGWTSMPLVVMGRSA